MTQTDGFTRKEKELLRQDRTPALIRQYAEDNPNDLRTRTELYTRIALGARAERVALNELHALAVVKARLRIPGAMKGVALSAATPPIIEAPAEVMAISGD